MAEVMEFGKEKGCAAWGRNETYFVCQSQEEDDDDDASRLLPCNYQQPYHMEEQHEARSAV